MVYLAELCSFEIMVGSEKGADAISDNTDDENPALLQAKLHPLCND